MRFKRLTLKDDPLFGDTSLEFEPGITVIYGLNRLSKASRNGNFAGKSYLMSSVPEVIWEQPVVGTREDRNRVGTRELEVTIQGKDYVFSRGSKLQVYEEGVLKFKSVRDTKKWVEGLPISESDFLGLYYLDSRRTHPLVMGTSSERAAYLTRFFNLDKIDAERKLIAARLSGLRTLKAQAEEVESALAALAENKPLSVEVDIDELKSRLKSLRRKQEKYLEFRRALEFAKAVAPQIRVLRDLIDFGDPSSLTEKVFRKARKAVASSLDEDSQTLKEARAFAVFTEQLRNYDKAIAGLTEEQKGALSKRLKYREAYEQYITLDPVSPGERPKKPKAVSRPTADIPALELRARELRHELEHATKFKSGKCPTCGSSVKARATKLIKKDLKIIEVELTAVRKQESAYRDYRDSMEKYRANLSEWKEESKQYARDRKRKAKLKPRALIYKAIRDVPEMPKPFKGRKLQVEVVERMVADGKRKLEALDQLMPSASLLAALTEKEPKDYSKRLRKLGDELSVARASMSARKAYNRQRRALQSRLEELQEQLQDEPALKILADAYNEKGMKRMAIEAVSNLLTQQLNKYSSVVFPSNYTFSIQWDKSRLSILCHRPEGKVKTTDVRKLSGAESRLFTYLLIFAQLQFVPKGQRSNLMVLDEPTTNMHPETAESFKGALTLLHTLIPTIVVITPQSSEFYDGAKALTIVRDKGKSKIVEGHPNTL